MVGLVVAATACIGEVSLNLVLLLLSSQCCMLCLQGKNPEKKRPKLCYHAKLHGKQPFLGNNSGLSHNSGRNQVKGEGVEKLLLSNFRIRNVIIYIQNRFRINYVIIFYPMDQQFTYGVVSKGIFAESLRKFCGKLAENNFFLLRQERVRKFCRKFAEICRTF